MISALFWPGDKKVSESPFCCSQLPGWRTQMIEVDSSQKGKETVHRQQAQAAVWDIARRLFSSGCLLSRMGPGLWPLEIFPPGETPFNLPCCELGLYWMSSRGLFYPTFFKDSVDLLCLKLILTSFYCLFHMLCKLFHLVRRTGDLISEVVSSCFRLRTRPLNNNAWQRTS